MIVLFPILFMFGNALLVHVDVSFSSYAQILTDIRQFKLLSTSLALAFGATAVSLVIGVPLALIIGRTDTFLRKSLQYFYLIPLIVPPYMSAIAWIDLFGNRGSVNIFLMNIFSLSEPPFAIYGLPGCMLILSLSYFPFVTLLTLSGLGSMNHRLEEAAALSHRPWGVVRAVTIPLVKPYVLSGVLFVFILAISNYAVPDLFRVNVYPVEIFIQFSAYYQEKVATTFSFPLVVITVAAILLIRHSMRNKSYVTLTTSTRRPPTVQLGTWKKTSLFFSFGLFVLSVLVPLACLIARSGSLASYRKALTIAHGQILTSAGLSLIAATAMVVLSFPLSYFVERSTSNCKGVVDTLSLIPFAIPPTILGIGLIYVWNRSSTQFVYGSLMILLFGYGGRFLPFVIRAIGANLKQIHIHIEEAALLCGGTWIRKLSRIVVPLCAPGIIAGWCLAYVFSLGELSTTLLVMPPGKTTLPIRIYTLMHYGANKLMAALCIILIGITLLPNMIIFFVKKRALAKVFYDRSHTGK